MILTPRLLLALSAPVAQTVSAQTPAAPSALFVPTVGLSLGSADGYPLLGAFVTLGFQTHRMDARISAEAAAFPGACADDLSSSCGGSGGAYLDISLGRRFNVTKDRLSSWQVGIGPSKGPRGAWFVSPHAEVQAAVGGVIFRLGARFRYGVAGDRDWYGRTPPSITAVYMSIGFADDGR